MITIHWIWLALIAGVIAYLGFMAAEICAAFSKKGRRHMETRLLVPGSEADRKIKDAVNRDEEEAIGFI